MFLVSQPNHMTPLCKPIRQIYQGHRISLPSLGDCQSHRFMTPEVAVGASNRTSTTLRCQVESLRALGLAVQVRLQQNMDTQYILEHLDDFQTHLNVETPLEVASGAIHQALALASSLYFSSVFGEISGVSSLDSHLL